MTIRKQINILIAFITIIPLLCLSFILVHHYFTSNSRYLMKGSKEITVFSDQNLNERDKWELVKILKNYPPYIECCVISSENKVIFSTIRNYRVNEHINEEKLWKYVNNTSDKYFYQFTTINLSSSRATLITRTYRSPKETPKPNTLIIIVLIMITALVFICIMFIYFVSKDIFKSLILIENITQEIADGDLTTKINLEEQKIKRNEITATLYSIEKMRIALLEERNRKLKFIMGISHDLRTPVSIIKGYIEAISDGIITDKQEFDDALDLIKSKTNQLEEMINSLINFMKLNSSELRNQLSPSSISDVLINFSKDAEITGYIFKRNIKTNINITENIIVPLNEQLVLRALENLYSNALRYTKENDTIEFNIYNRENILYFEIKDTGAGIAESDLKYIFDIFYRGTNSRHEEGMGIGLSVVNNIISIHEWKINVESELGKGTCFTIEIPYSKN